MLHTYRQSSQSVNNFGEHSYAIILDPPSLLWNVLFCSISCVSSLGCDHFCVFFAVSSWRQQNLIMLVPRMGTATAVVALLGFRYVVIFFVFFHRRIVFFSRCPSIAFSSADARGKTDETDCHTILIVTSQYVFLRRPTLIRRYSAYSTVNLPVCRQFISRSSTTLPNPNASNHKLGMLASMLFLSCWVYYSSEIPRCIRFIESVAKQNRQTILFP